MRMGSDSMKRTPASALYWRVLGINGLIDIARYHDRWSNQQLVAIGIAAKTGHPISFWQFTRYGIVFTAFSTVPTWIYLALRYF